MVVNNYWGGIIIGIFICTSPSMSRAAPANQDKSVTIEANSAQLDDQSGLSVYNGNVSITQGSLHINADKVTAYHKNGSVNKIIADGSPARYEQTADSKEGIVNASANTINYLPDEHKIVLTGNATLEQRGDTVQGQSITYDMKRKIGNAGNNTKTNNQDDGRVKMIFQPKSKPTQQPTDAKAP